MFENKFPENLYHSYIIEGEPEATARELISYLETRKIIEPKSQNVLCQIYDGFAIGDSPLIKSWHSERGPENQKRICIIGAKFINREAEHSLLKILEEPAINTHFFLIVPNASVLLPTILSRAHVIKNERREEGLGKKFLNANPQDRLDIISKLTKSHSDDEDSAPLRHDAINLLNNLEEILHHRLTESTERQGLSVGKDLVFSLGEIAQGREYLNLPGCSVKMILEHIALVI